MGGVSRSWRAPKLPLCKTGTWFPRPHGSVSLRGARPMLWAAEQHLGAQAAVFEGLSAYRGGAGPETDAPVPSASILPPGPPMALGLLCPENKAQAPFIFPARPWREAGRTKAAGCIAAVLLLPPHPLAHPFLPFIMYFNRVGARWMALGKGEGHSGLRPPGPWELRRPSLAQAQRAARRRCHTGGCQQQAHSLPHSPGVARWTHSRPPGLTLTLHCSFPAPTLPGQEALGLAWWGCRGDPSPSPHLARRPIASSRNHCVSSASSQLSYAEAAGHVPRVPLAWSCRLLQAGGVLTPFRR